ncbi:hypothetical protein DFQ28_000849 [Apophysomyces sp. BC1034]|nr:hypothetical protein DFQ30_004421 [Apophysomyces sp. BC1015]KAG0181102.1 hypothetical protein DFQ29_009333 [Apophysomyces sp. BC1021]KAG0191146.1 hypothetical protein DFQ28_000849 [Apophysomyces sp. BC1034]
MAINWMIFRQIDPTSPDYFLYGRSFEALQFMSDLEKSFDSPQYGLPHRHGCHRGQDSHNRSPVYDDNDPVLQENHQELPIPSSHHPHDEMHKTVNSANYNTVSKTKTLTFLPTKLFNLDIFVGGGFSKGAGQVEIRQSTEPTQELAIVNVTILSTSEDLLDSIDIADTEDWSTFYTAIRSTYRKKQQHDCSRKRDFLSYKIDIVFPPNLDYFDTLKLQLRQANSIQVKELETVFQTFSIGVARGDIALDRLVAYNIHLGALHGNITGNYTPRTSFIAVAARGSTDITLLPHGYVIDAIAIAVQGSSSVFLPVDGFRGLFDVGQATTGRERLVYVLEQSDIDFYEVGKKRVTGSFKDDTRSNVIVRSQDGQATLSFI